MDPLVSRLAFYGFMLQDAPKQKKKKLQSAAASEISLDVSLCTKRVALPPSTQQGNIILL